MDAALISSEISTLSSSPVLRSSFMPMRAMSMRVSGRVFILSP